MMQISTSTHRRAGFTLAEILLAMLVFAIAITTILALLARSIETVDEIVLKDEAMRLSSAVERELSRIPFNDLFPQVRQATFANPLELNVFHYRAEYDENRTPHPDRTDADALILPFVTFRASPQTEPFTQETAFGARDGRFFRVLLSVSPTNPIQGDLSAIDPDDYESAAIVLYARFIPLGAPGINTPATPRVIYSYNFAVRR